MIKVLLVDDHRLFLDALNFLIKAQPDFEVVGTAESIKAAARKVNTLRPDLVLMDYQLAGAAGMDATRAILDVHPSVNIVLLTLHEKENGLFDSIRFGVKGILVKSMPSVEFLTSLRGLGQGQAT